MAMISGAGIAKAVANQLSSEEGRKNLTVIIVVSVSVPIVLISLFYYILTSPITLLKQYFSESRIEEIESLKEEYGFVDFLDDTSTYEDIEGEKIETLGGIAVVYYNQLDGRWKTSPLGQTGTIGKHGCAPTSMAMVISSLTGSEVDPIHMAAWTTSNDYFVEGTGSKHSLIPAAAEAFGLGVTSVNKSDISNIDKIVTALMSGKLVVARMGKGTFTTTGHFIVLRGMDADGKVLIADPASKKRTNMSWDFYTIWSEARGFSSSLGPFWIIQQADGTHRLPVTTDRERIK